MPAEGDGSLLTLEAVAPAEVAGTVVPVPGLRTVDVVAEEEVEPLLRSARADLVMLRLRLRSAEAEADDAAEASTGRSEHDTEVLVAELGRQVAARRTELAVAVDEVRAEVAAVLAAAEVAAAATVGAAKAELRAVMEDVVGHVDLPAPVRPLPTPAPTPATDAADLGERSVWAPPPPAAVLTSGWAPVASTPVIEVVHVEAAPVDLPAPVEVVHVEVARVEAAPVDLPAPVETAPVALTAPAHLFVAPPPGLAPTLPAPSPAAPLLTAAAPEGADLSPTPVQLRPSVWTTGVPTATNRVSSVRRLAHVDVVLPMVAVLIVLVVLLAWVG